MMGDDTARSATCHIRLAHRHVEPLRGHAAEIARLFNVKLLLPPPPGASGARTRSVPRGGQNANDLLLVPLQRILSGCAADTVEGGSQSSAMHEIAAGVQDLRFVIHGRDDSRWKGYTARVEFALKLGYTERLVQAALQKLGPDPGQNELLAELIKLGATCSPRLSDGPEESDGLLDAEMGADEGGGSILATTMATATNTTSSAGLRPVVIDGSNVAMSHGNKEMFSCRGIKICVDWFRARGHKEITVFVPKWRKEASRPDNPVADQEILGELEKDRLLVFTPSREKLFFLKSNLIKQYLPLELDWIKRSFIKSPQKCTYGNKCKFRHPERGPHPHKSVTERLVEHAQRHLQARGPSLSLPLPSTTASVPSQHPPLCKARSALPPNVVQSLSSVPKSRSVENVTSDLSATSPAMYSQPMPIVQNAQGYPSTVNWAAPRVSNPEPEPANMHRKLQRQLTLNPACDPRLYQLRRYHHQQQQAGQSPPQQQQQSVISPPRSSMQHRPLTRHASNESSYPITAMSWDHPDRLQHHHQHVTRIASAPDSYRAWPPRGTTLVPPSRVQRLGTSDPQLNLLPSPPPTSLHVPWGTQAQDARRRLHYHLANIFPEEQVQAAMALHPHETDAQQICAAILAMFPKT
ncbi:hypothetical protein DMN91_006817 [Ooceraea biroi]|uniref:C3H1-type domain-containing protein n=1 Tax=Ooceraea biroi TaxID=2015173 RepID=A0A3L8DIE5_OOCBI|nr:hypothetical protein DMN91_006817 [Ooceraea biroi]